ncbi:hypothetical protein EMIHUDRAFT_244974 [Emiliania huxleyi CCMP1516]|uniref:Uncharacterized protein n=2 Tax=Emiliania huxleyi TaxID=2903 RepID=A0A0D3IZ70_EMIH1|nr:hypothetical protein EMIHUDRAFT_244974 [Emiliania huxleyi CCMP1516]EOD16555.1 hypothetical protein EMIHUDRAFT_244974 [Emiliania huxleyi CCMP1516]|eukprot:XP_005768984.1 hypothetical protein EMIHUDRAFT_244974 [Emiliania huxleyi CCMP1516]
MRSLALQPRPLLSPSSIGCRALAPTAYQSALSDAVLWAADPIVGDVVGPVCSALTCRLTLGALLAAAAAALLWLPFGAVPARLLPLLCWWTVPLSVVSYYGQVADTRRTGQYDATLAEVRLRLIGSLVRVGTTLRFLAGDRAVLANHFVGLLGCSLILLAQREWRKTGALGRVELRKALSHDNWRDYRSLGGFEGRWSLRWSVKAMYKMSAYSI